MKAISESPPDYLEEYTRNEVYREDIKRDITILLKELLERAENL